MNKPTNIAEKTVLSKNVKTDSEIIDKQEPVIAVLLPCYNEALTIGKVVDDFRESLPRADIYVYDNNSTDDTAKIALEHGAIVRKETRQGKGRVVRSMFRDIDADYYIMADGDDTYPAEKAIELLTPLINNEADMVVGDRLSNGSYGAENTRAMHGVGNALVCHLISGIYKCRFEDVMSGYRAMTRAFVKSLPVLSKGFQIETEISIYAADRDWRIIEIPIDYRDRPEGSVSKLNTIGDGTAVLMAIASLCRENKPLLFFGLIALLFALVGVIVGAPVIAEYIDAGYVWKVPSAILASGFMACAAVLMSCGIILDMVARLNRKQWEIQVYHIAEESKQLLHNR